MAKSRKAQPSGGKCVFCGGGPLSKEHLWSEWMHPLFPDELAQQSHAQLLTLPIRDAVGKVEVLSDLQRKRGHGAARKIRKFCEGCNNGWMGALDDSVAPGLGSLIQGMVRDLSTDEIRVIAAWLALKSIVAEYTHPASAVVTDADRRHVHATSTPPAAWSMFMGRAERKAPRFLHYHHQQNFLHFKSLPGYSISMQMTVMILGEVFFLVVSTAEDALAPFHHRIALAGVSRIWPAPTAPLVLADLPVTSVPEAMRVWGYFWKALVPA